MKFDYKELIDEVRSKNFWPRLLIMVIGVFILSVTYNLFFLRYELVTGGTSGLAIIINHLFDIDPALFIFIIEHIEIFVNCTKHPFFWLSCTKHAALQ